jgi:nucleoside 2-deoxyribosyltransferase
MKNRTIEDFDLPLNLMISCSVKKIIVGDLEKVLREL